VIGQEFNALSGSTSVVMSVTPDRIFRHLIPGELE